jgi:hypothetical protein
VNRFARSLRCFPPLVALALAALLPAESDAQIITIASNLLSKVEQVAVYPIIPVSMGKASKDLVQTGLGLEFSFGIGEWTRPMNDDERASRCRQVRKSGGTCNDATTKDTSLTLTSIQRRANENAKDSSWAVEVTPLEVSVLSFSLTVASKLTSIGSDEIVPGWQLRGKIQEFPTFTVYTAYRPDRSVSPYFGLTVTPGELKNVKVTQGDSTATVEASDIGYGASAGLVFDVKGGKLKTQNLSVFTELEYTETLFGTTGWKRPQNLSAAQLPSRIALQGLRLTFGVEFALSDK